MIRLQHTPEPWITRGLDKTITDAEGHTILTTLPVDGDSGNNSCAVANAWRAVQCVNACAGLEAPTLVIPELVSALRGLLEVVEQDSRLPVDYPATTQAARAVLSLVDEI